MKFKFDLDKCCNIFSLFALIDLKNMFETEHLLEKIGLDTAESVPSKLIYLLYMFSQPPAFQVDIYKKLPIQQPAIYFGYGVRKWSENYLGLNTSALRLDDFGLLVSLLLSPLNVLDLRAPCGDSGRNVYAVN